VVQSFCSGDSKKIYRYKIFQYRANWSPKILVNTFVKERSYFFEKNSFTQLPCCNPFWQLPLVEVSSANVTFYKLNQMHFGQPEAFAVARSIAREPLCCKRSDATLLPDYLSGRTGLVTRPALNQPVIAMAKG